MAESAHTLQAALDDWATVAPKLEHEADALARHAPEDSFAFDANHCPAPMPPAYQWACRSAYDNHLSLLRTERGADMPDAFWRDPPITQGASDVRTSTCSGGKEGDHKRTY